ncbi:hypothetical protein H2201_006407 [Coniosporium apollinis]|uniref:Uncharacterized protein n=1 Tax=Coniosporium apollinis TaxID=61459 RepID=A0ABQ9NMV5_9PEZI|nr:hypothetical protein H2201_006407 [Coniosporium apollinis]
MGSILDTIQGFLGGLGDGATGILDSFFPPEKRAEVLARLQSFAVGNPKLSAFLLSNIALTGVPLFFFFLFTLTVFVFSLVAALLVGVLAALLFTAFMVGVALLVVLPTVFITTLGASFLFLWGLGGYYILKWLNGDSAPAGEGEAIGDKINNLTGGRLDFLMGPAREMVKTGQIHGGVQDQQPGHGGRDKQANGTPEKKQANGTSVPGQKHVGDAAKGVKDGLDTVQKNSGVDGVQKKLDVVQKRTGGTLGTVKGTLGGATGLT